jgi:hypothetical protein
MRVKKIMLGLVAAFAIAAGAALVPTKQAAAEGGFDCMATQLAGADCGCPKCWIKNCTCPKYPVESEGSPDGETAN